MVYCTYVAASNRTQMTVTGTETYTVAYSYDANNRLQTETKTQTGGNTAAYYTYDANGNTLSRTVLAGGNTTEATAFSYDRFNRLISLTGGGTVYYSYNANGIRTAKLTNGIQTSFLLDGGDVVAELQNDVLYASYLRRANLICREANNSAEYYLFDAHADVIALTDEDGDLTKNYDYDAFGCEKQPDPLDTNPFRYCGEYFDIESDSYYLRARYYAPTIGRFTQQDTHWSTANMIYGDNPQKINERQDALGLNTYTMIPQITAVMQAGNQYVYGINNPTFYTDPYGTLIWPGEIHNAVSNHIIWTELLYSGRTLSANVFVPMGGIKFGFADLYDQKTKEVWEIKPEKDKYYTSGPRQLKKYIDNIDGARAGSSLRGDSFYYFSPGINGMIPSVYYITYRCTVDGMIYYEYKEIVDGDEIAAAIALTIIGGCLDCMPFPLFA